MINLVEISDSNDRLNMILDKISKLGIKSLDSEEIIFLQSYSTGKEDEVNILLNNDDSKRTFLSDDGLFTFKLNDVDYVDDVCYINGSLTVPDIVMKNKKRINGYLKGNIIVFIDGSVAIDFNTNKYDVFDFVGGIEYELDCFVDEIVLKIIKK